MALFRIQVQRVACAMAYTNTLIKSRRCCRQEMMKPVGERFTVSRCVQGCIASAYSFQCFDRRGNLTTSFCKLSDRARRQRSHGSELSHGPNVNSIKIEQVPVHSHLITTSLAIHAQLFANTPDSASRINYAKNKAGSVQLCLSTLFSALRRRNPKRPEERPDGAYGAYPDAPVACLHAFPRGGIFNVPREK